jgi:hypothetical protein
MCQHHQGVSRRIDKLAEASTEAQNTKRSGRENSASPRLGGETERYELEMSFSRGLHPDGFVASTTRSGPRTLWRSAACISAKWHAARRQGIHPTPAPLKPGDSVVFDAGSEQKEEGGRVL